MRSLLKFLFVAIPFALLGAAAWAGGPSVNTVANITCPNGSATQAIAVSTPVAGETQPNRLCVDITNIDTTNSVLIGDANISATRGDLIFAKGSKSFCVTSALQCWGLSGAVIISIMESVRQ